MAAWLWHRLRRAFAPVATLPCLALILLVGAGPASAAERIKVAADGGGGVAPSGTLTGALIRAANATTSWFLYPGACTDRANGTWSPRSTPQADSLNTYPAGTTGPYTILDQTAYEILWHVSDDGSCTR